MTDNVPSEVVDLIAGPEPEPTCFRCHEPASEFYTEMAEIEGMESAAEYARQEEGTYNPETNHFACDGCYIAIGMPTGSRGWKAP